jgi:hypothetical protein
MLGGRFRQSSWEFFLLLLPTPIFVAFSAYFYTTAYNIARQY